MPANHSFVRAFIKSRVGTYSLPFLYSGLLSAWLSNRLSDAWWGSYLQNLSATLIGVWATVWLINYSLDLQAREASRNISSATGKAAANALSHISDRIGSWMPKVSAPDQADLYQLSWINSRVEQARALCASLASICNDAELRTLLVAFELSESMWSERLSEVSRLVRSGAPDADRTASFSGIEKLTADLTSSSKTLAMALAEFYHDAY